MLKPEGKNSFFYQSQLGTKFYKFTIFKEEYMFFSANKEVLTAKVDLYFFAN